eukprot:scaffold15927_cov67-Isochrysis_galbana.AAC.1
MGVGRWPRKGGLGRVEGNRVPWPRQPRHQSFENTTGGRGLWATRGKASFYFCALYKGGQPFYFGAQEADPRTNFSSGVL